MKKRVQYNSISIVLTVFILLSSCSSTEELPPWGENENVLVKLSTNQGEIVIRLYTDISPLHSENFARLCVEDFYDGTNFHRVAAGVMIQGGDFNTKDDDPSNDGRGGHSYLGPGTTLEAEINDLTHKRGIVSMARGSQLNSAGSQFFIMLRDDPLLDGKYSIFGEVTSGMEVVELIAEQPGQEYLDIGGVKPEKPQVIEDCSIVLPNEPTGL
jgi:cyclophilin family peptidyl-prolyl cis-trans isomerase